MTVLWVRHDDSLAHDTGLRHPEKPDRLRWIVRAFDAAGLTERMSALAFDPVALDALHAIHAPAYVASVAKACVDRKRALDAGDTVICERSEAIARRATGGVVAACDAVWAGSARRAFCTHRPPGHHAEKAHATGFCIYNHIAVAAEHMIRRHGLNRVAIVDFDVHHGNGTQHAFEDRSDVLFISIHQDPSTIYPGMGFAHERGHGAGEGFTLNLPMAPGSGDDAYRDAFECTILPRLEQFAPEFLLISAGFDAAASDPLASMELTDEAFAWMTDQLVAVADRHTGGRLVSVLEGGYHPEGLAGGAVAHARSLLGDAFKN